MALARFVVEGRALLHQRAEGGAVEGRLPRGDGSEDLVGEIDRRAPVAVGHADQGFARILVERQRPLLLLLGAQQQILDRLLAETIEDEHRGAREHGAVELEGRIFRRRTDEGDRAVFHMRQEAVLLGTIEAMDLVDEQQRAPALLAARLGAVEGFAQILHAGEDGRKLLELELRLVGEQPRHRRLAGTRRPPEDEARQPAALEHARQGAAGTDELILSDDLGKLRRPQPVGERAGRALLKSCGFEQRRH